MTNALLRDKSVAMRIPEAGRVGEFVMKWAEPLVEERVLKVFHYERMPKLKRDYIDDDALDTSCFEALRKYLRERRSNQSVSVATWRSTSGHFTVSSPRVRRSCSLRISLHTTWTPSTSAWTVPATAMRLAPSRRTSDRLDR